MSGVCAGIKRSGGRCTVSVGPGETYCHHHDPARAQERRRAASRAGRSKPSRELAAIKKLLSDLTDRVIFTEGTEYLPANHAAVAGQLINTWLRAVDLERKVRETEELEGRIEALESAAGKRKEGRWGA